MDRWRWGRIGRAGGRGKKRGRLEAELGRHFGTDHEIAH